MGVIAANVKKDIEIVSLKKSNNEKDKEIAELKLPNKTGQDLVILKKLEDKQNELVDSVITVNKKDIEIECFKKSEFMKDKEIAELKAELLKNHKIAPEPHKKVQAIVPETNDTKCLTNNRLLVSNENVGLQGKKYLVNGQHLEQGTLFI